MVPTQKLGSGWTLGEALQLTVDPALLAAERAVQLKRPSDRFIGFAAIIDPSPAQKLARQRYDDWTAAHGRVVRELVEHLKSDRLVAYGRPRVSTAQPIRIPASAWSILRIANWEASILKEKEQTLYDVRIYPVLESSEVVDRLEGITMVEACREHVVGDPEAIAKSTATEGGQQFGRRFGSSILWPVNDMASRHELDGCAGSSDKSHCQDAASHVVRRRFAAMISLLRHGSIIAYASPGGTAASAIPVPREVWRDGLVHLDPSRGDLLKLQRGAETCSEWVTLPFSALTLEKPDVPFAAAAPVRMVSKINSCTECQAWLVGQMKLNPDAKPQSKQAFWNDALKKWPNRLTRSSFDSAWASALKQSGASWSKPGAPRKSTNRNQCIP